MTLLRFACVLCLAFVLLFFIRSVLSKVAQLTYSVANLAENPLDFADFASIWRKIFAFGGQRISMQVLVEFFQNRGFLKKILQ